MGLSHWLRAGFETHAKRRFLLSRGYHETKAGDWVSDFCAGYVQKRDFRRWTLAELRFNYICYLL